MTDLSAKLDEMLAGLEGVTPGVWSTKTSAGGVDILSSSREYISLATIHKGGRLAEEMVANADHIARCGPDTMRRIITLAQKALRTTEAGEVVAWRGDIPGGVRKFTAIKRVSEIWADQGLTVTPLYAHPATQDAVVSEGCGK